MNQWIAYNDIVIYIHSALNSYNSSKVIVTIGSRNVLESLWIFVDETSYHVDLFDARSNGIFVLSTAWHVGSPKLHTKDRIWFIKNSKSAMIYSDQIE